MDEQSAKAPKGAFTLQTLEVLLAADPRLLSVAGFFTVDHPRIHDWNDKSIEVHLAPS